MDVYDLYFITEGWANGEMVSYQEKYIGTSLFPVSDIKTGNSFASSGGGITVENSDGIPWTGDDVRISYNDNGGINNVRFVNDDGTGIIYFSDRITTYNVSMDFYGRHNYSSYFENKMGYIRGYRGGFGDHMMSILKGVGGGIFHGAFDGGRMSWMAGWQQGRMDSKAGLSRRLFIEYWPNNQIKIHR
jgi:hypothetical protein